MYSEYCFIGDMLHHRSTPDGAFIKCSLEEVNRYLVSLINKANNLTKENDIDMTEGF